MKNQTRNYKDDFKQVFEQNAAQLTPRNNVKVKKNSENNNILKKLILEDTKINEYLKKGYITNIDEKVLFLNKKHNKFIQKSLKLNFPNK